MTKIKYKEFLVGYDILKEKVDVYNNTTEASRNSHHWCVIQATTAKEAKEMYIEKYTVELEDYRKTEE